MLKDLLCGKSRPESNTRLLGFSEMWKSSRPRLHLQLWPSPAVPSPHSQPTREHECIPNSPHGPAGPALGRHLQVLIAHPQSLIIHKQVPSPRAPAAPALGRHLQVLDEEAALAQVARGHPVVAQVVQQLGLAWCGLTQKGS